MLFHNSDLHPSNVFIIIITIDIPIVAKAGAEVDIKSLRDVYGILNGDKYCPNLGRRVKTLPAFLNLEEHEFIWNGQTGKWFYEWKGLLDLVLGVHNLLAFSMDFFSNLQFTFIGIS